MSDPNSMTPPLSPLPPIAMEEGEDGIVDAARMDNDELDSPLLLDDIGMFY
jgi:hypothetical protein